MAPKLKLLAVCSAGALLLFSGYILFYKLGNEPFQDYDEATYAQVTHESIEHGEPSSLSFLNTPFFRKPPLLIWMTTASTRVFKDPEFSDRFPSALAGLAALGIVALICIEAGVGTGAGVWIGLATAAILATTAAWMEPARDFRFDTLVAFFDVASLYAAIRATRDSRWLVMVGILLALAILSKSVFALYGGIAVLAILIYERKFPRVFYDRQFWFGIGAFFLVGVPWHLYMTLTYGAAFWHEYIGTEVLQRAGSNLFPGNGNPTSPEYVGYLFNMGAPWMQLLVLELLSTPFLFRRLPERMRNIFAASFVAALSVLVVSFVARTKAYGYLIPVFPFLAVMTALLGWAVWEWVRRRAEKSAAKRSFAALLTAFMAGICIVLFAHAAIFTRYEALHLDPYYSWDVSQAYEERAVSQIIRAAPHPVVYAYNGYDFLGTIYYYTGLPDTPNPYILLWSASSTPSATNTNFIVTTSSLQSLSSSFPQYRFTQDYSGRFVSLFTVTAAR